MGGGYRLGHLDAAGQLTGPEASFLYPDLVTGLTVIWSSAWVGATGLATWTLPASSPDQRPAFSILTS